MQATASLLPRFPRSGRPAGRWSSRHHASRFLQARGGVLDPQGPIASAERLLLINATAIMLVVVVPVILATLGFAWWYRSSNARASRSPDEVLRRARRVRRLVDPGAGRDPAWAGSCWIGSHELDPRAPIAGERQAACRSTSWRSIGNGCSSTPIRASPRSISWSSRRERRSTSGSPRRR